jgi:uncharacterized membrane protein (UPF0127 family)
MDFQFRYNNQDVKMDIMVCDNILTRALGLMFRQQSKPLLFLFGRPVSEPIHSWFCVPFICIWFLEEKIVDVQLVKPWRMYVCPKDPFDRFLEIPSNDPNFVVLEQLLN